MSSINKKTTSRTHEGGPAKSITPEQALKRSVMACMLWENQFYEDGQTIADRITDLCGKVQPSFIASTAIEARTHYKLRHAPLLLLSELARHGEGKMVGETIKETIQRADELTEFMAVYWRNGKKPLSAQIKKGLAAAFQKFDAYQLAKYDRPGLIRLRDVLFLCHAKPKDKQQERAWKQLIDDQLPVPDTWEVSLTKGEDKKTTFERLITNRKLGYMALLRNLRNMHDAGVSKGMVENALNKGAVHSKALPFRFLSAAAACPAWEDAIETAMLKSCEGMKKLPGRTAIVVDCSGSMEWGKVSAKSHMSYLGAACALAILVREISDECDVYAYGDIVRQVRPRRGFALSDELCNAHVGSWTKLGNAVRTVNEGSYDRSIIITDEQTADRVPNPKGTGYIINVAAAKNGVGYGPWNHIDGWSEATINWIQELEST